VGGFLLRFVVVFFPEEYSILLSFGYKVSDTSWRGDDDCKTCW